MACEAEDAEVSIQGGLVDQAFAAMEAATTVYNFRVTQLMQAVMAAVACHEQNQMMKSESESDPVRGCVKTAVKASKELCEHVRDVGVIMKQLRAALRTE